MTEKFGAVLYINAMKMEYVIKIFFQVAELILAVIHEQQKNLN